VRILWSCWSAALGWVYACNTYSDPISILQYTARNQRYAFQPRLQVFEIASIDTTSSSLSCCTSSSRLGRAADCSCHVFLFGLFFSFNTCVTGVTNSGCSSPERLTSFMFWPLHTCTKISACLDYNLSTNNIQSDIFVPSWIKKVGLEGVGLWKIVLPCCQLSLWHTSRVYLI
jgi:hypothetical protein